MKPRGLTSAVDSFAAEVVELRRRVAALERVARREWTWVGDWSAGDYAYNDAVTGPDGDLWVCTNDTGTSGTPGVSADWELVVVGTADAVTDSIADLEAGANYSTITPATGFSASLFMVRRGIWAFMTTTITRTGANVSGVGTVNIATIGTGGRGAFTGATQALTQRSYSQSNMFGTTTMWYTANTGVLSARWDSSVAWNTGSAVAFTGVVLLDSTP
jgi:hypothetical protein